MNTISVLFFGSTTDSVIVLERLHSFTHRQFALHIAAVVTQPPRPVGRSQMMTKTPVQEWAETHETTVLAFPSNAEKPWLYQDEQTVIDTLETMTPDLIISASYGQKIPTKILTDARFGGLNVHPSILPRWRGGDPVPWAILTGDHQTGVTVVSLSDKFDEGKLYAQEKVPITFHDTSDPLRTALFVRGADLLVTLLPEYLSGKAKGADQKKSDEPRATRLTRDLGFEPWEMITRALTDSAEAKRIERKFRALTPWPGLWTTIIPKKGNGPEAKRLKILALHLDHETLVIDSVQLEGKTAVQWNQFLRAYIS